jgi:hypothetical protein
MFEIMADCVSGAVCVCPLANGRLHGMCGQRSPRLRLWSRNTASCDSIRATVQLRKAGLLLTTSYCVSMSLHQLVIF